MLTPILLALAMDNVLTTLEKRAGERTIVWKSAIADRRPARCAGTRSSPASRPGRSRRLARAADELPDGQRISRPLDPGRRGRDRRTPTGCRARASSTSRRRRSACGPATRCPSGWTSRTSAAGPAASSCRRSVPADAPPGPLTRLRRRRQRGHGVRSVALSRRIRTRSTRSSTSSSRVRPREHAEPAAYRAGSRRGRQRRGARRAAADARRAAARPRPGRRHARPRVPAAAGRVDRAARSRVAGRRA